MWIGIAVILLALVLALVPAFGKGGAEPAKPADGRLQIVTTVGMLGDIVRQVAQTRAEVVSIIGEGVDPHLFTPTRSDVLLLLEADVIFYVGLLLEGRMSDILDRVGETKPAFAVTTLLDEEYLIWLNEKTRYPDPHVWMDPEAWGRAVEAVAEALSMVEPDNADFYRANANGYLSKIDELDRYAHIVLAAIPPEKRILVTAHDAFGYFGNAYDIEVYGIQGISTESEAGLNDIIRLVDLLVTRRIEAIFVETSVADKNVRALIEGAAARRHRVRIGGTLFSDAMGASGTYEGTYLGMIDHNVTVIAAALGGSPPERGLNANLNITERERNR